jgi:hypothetical protein
LIQERKKRKRKKNNIIYFLQIYNIKQITL